ncbi:MAG: hypothetical protein ACLPZR_33865 [Solirubrobacteraceae bacterium]
MTQAKPKAGFAPQLAGVSPLRALTAGATVSHSHNHDPTNPANTILALTTPSTANADAPAALRAVRIDRRSRGGWEIEFADEPEQVVCRTLAHAKQVAYRYASHGSPCEMIVHDAYHRVSSRQTLPHAKHP